MTLEQKVETPEDEEARRVRALREEFAHLGPDEMERETRHDCVQRPKKRDDGHQETVEAGFMIALSMTSSKSYCTTL